MFERYADPDARLGAAETLTETPLVRLGPGVLHEIGIVAEQLGMHRALVVCDPNLQNSPAVRLMGVRLAEHNVPSHIATTVTPTPRYADVDAAVTAMRKHKCDGVVTFGGGSTHDVGKVAALIGKHGGTIHDYAHEHRDPPADTFPHIAVNTTAGTGAESSGYAFLLADNSHEHTILYHSILVPEAVFLDPLTHLSMPPNVTAATGLNALADAIEAYVSRTHTPESDEAALAAMRLIAQHLPHAYHHGDDLGARTEMARAAYLAGVAFNKAGLGIVDSISLVLSEMFNIGHSAANAIVLPHVMAYDAFSVGDRMGDVAKALGRQVEGGDRRAMAQAAITAVEDLKREVGLTQTLSDRGLTWDDLYLCARQILHHPFIKRNPRPLDEAGLTQILLGSMETQRIIVDEPPTKAAAT